MAIFGIEKKEKAPNEPQYFTSATNEQVYNYNVYYMSVKEKILYFILAFIVGGAVGYLFYGGLAKDGYGNATTVTHVLNVVISCFTGLIATKIFLPVRTKQLMNKKKTELNLQFRDMLDGLTTSIGSGKNVPDSFIAVKEDLIVQYGEESNIVKELENIIVGINNNIHIEDLLMDFGNRSGNDDIKSFANVFKISYRKGGNLNDIVRNTHEILSDKMQIKEEIATAVSGSKMSINIMIVMPVVLIALIKSMSPEFSSNFATPSGIAATTIAVVLFVVAYFVGSKMMNIDV